MSRDTPTGISRLAAAAWFTAHAADPVLMKTWGPHPRRDDLAVVKRPHKKGLTYQQISLSAPDGGDIDVPAFGNDPLQLLVGGEDAGESLHQLASDTSGTWRACDAYPAGCADVSVLLWALARAEQSPQRPGASRHE